MPLHRSVILVARIAMLGLVVQACALTGTVTSARSWTTAAADSSGNTLQTAVNDTSGRVQDITLDPADARPGPAVAVAPGIANALDVTWAGGVCDDQTTIDIAAAGAGLVVTVRTHQPARPCDAMAVQHVIRLQLAQPIPPAMVTVRQ